MEFIKHNKLFIALASSVLLFFFWANTSSFRLLRLEGGEKWKPHDHQTRIHHK